MLYKLLRPIPIGLLLCVLCALTFAVNYKTIALYKNASNVTITGFKEVNREVSVYSNDRVATAIVGKRYPIYSNGIIDSRIRESGDKIGDDVRLYFNKENPNLFIRNKYKYIKPCFVMVFISGVYWLALLFKEIGMSFVVKNRKVNIDFMC